MRALRAWLGAALSALSAVPASAQYCPVDSCFRGRGNSLRSECVLQWAHVRQELTACADGAACDLDGAVDGRCRFAVAPCLDVATCVVGAPPRLDAVQLTPADAPGAVALRGVIEALAAEASGVARCASAVTIDVSAEGNGTLALDVRARAAQLRDRDRLVFRCLPADTRPRLGDDVQPILSARCTPGCHEPGGRMAGVDLSPGAAWSSLIPYVRAGRPRASLLVAFTLRRSMPPGCHRRLGPEWAPGGCPTRDEIRLVSDWIALGAPAD